MRASAFAQKQGLPAFIRHSERVVQRKKTQVTPTLCTLAFLATIAFLETIVL